MQWQRILWPVQETQETQVTQGTQVKSLGQEDPLEEEMQPTPVFLPGESHGQRSLAGYSPRGHKGWDIAMHARFYTRDPTKLPHPFCHLRTQERSVAWKRAPIWRCGHPGLRLLGFRTVSSTFLLFASHADWDMSSVKLWWTWGRRPAARLPARGVVLASRSVLPSLLSCLLSPMDLGWLLTPGTLRPLCCGHWSQVWVGSKPGFSTL